MQGREDPCVLSLTMIVNVGGIYSVKISYNSPWLRVSLFRHMGIFLLEGFSTLGSLFRHTFSKIFKYNNLCFQNIFFILKTQFFTSQKLIFPLLVQFHQFQAL